MAFKKEILFFAILSIAMGLTGCTGVYGDPQAEDNHNIGNPTKSVAALHTPDEGESTNLVLFDKTVRRIHQFDLINMKHLRSFAVRNPSEDHHVLFGNNGNYIVDLSLKGLSIFDQDHQAHHQPIQFQGNPKSAAFLPSQGLLVVYDDLMSVGILKLGSSGKVLNKWVGGPLVIQGASISAGDLNAEGKLILGLTNGSVVVVDDLEKCMNEKRWGNLDPFISGLGDIKWVAPLPKQPHQVLVRTESQLLLLDIVQRSQIASYSLLGQVLKLSKYEDPHVVVESGGKIKVLFAANSEIQERTYIPHLKSFEMYYLLSSRLDLQNDSWSFVDTKEAYFTFFNDLNGARKKRRFARYRLSDSLATHHAVVADDVQVEMAQGFLFSLHPSELGYAVRYDIDQETTSELKLFNMKYYPAD